MTADEHRPRLCHLLRSAAQNLREFEGVALLDGIAEDVHGGNGSASHRIDIGEGVGRGYLPEEVRVVYNRREKVNGLNEGEMGGYLVDPGIVAGGETDE
ncbi:hypothetical protein LBMAG21_15410 [Armatimonadota bacterium]|nr:hypothetical protein LBMAG21_15410 [Armatimonadota bacterium]